MLTPEDKIKNVEDFLEALTKLCREYDVDIDADREGQLYAEPCPIENIKGSFKLTDTSDFTISWRA